ncbi:MAG: Ig domain-containing protein [Kiritimatiellae bacterium]|nr:Ig domain-containing protein [Kiritimatiellia bacterium]
MYGYANAVAVTSVSLSQTEATLNIGETLTLTATVTPDDATDKTVKWSVGGTNAGAVKLYTDETCTTEVGTDATSALTVYALGLSAGEATVTVASNADATKSATCTVTVSVPASAYETWAAANGVTGELGDKDANGIYNAFRYVFGQPTGDFALIADIDVGESEVVITTPAVANSDGVTVLVVESSDLAGETVTDTKALEAEGRAEFTKSAETPRFYRLKAVEAE